MSKVGNTDIEIDANQLSECRKIVRNLVDFGLTEKQKIQIVYLLSLELESRDAMNILVESVKKIRNLDENVKFSLTNHDNEYNKEVTENKKPKLLDI